MRHALLLLCLCSSLAPARGEWLLEDVAPAAGVELENVCGSHVAKRYIIEQNGSGGAVFDYDGDGDLDLYLVNGGDNEILAGEREPVRNALYRNEGDWRFVDVSEQAGVADPTWGMGVAVGDIDRDGDPDLYVSNLGANLLYENLGDGRFRDITDQAGVGDDGWGHSTGFGDIDQDGDLDLYVTNNLVWDQDLVVNDGRPCQYREIDVACGPIGFPKQKDHLYRNDGKGIFTEISKSSGIHEVGPEHGLGVVFGDLDRDSRLDIYVANDSGANFLFRNLGGGRFEEIAWMAGIATQNEGRFQAGMGVALGDADGDGLTDIFVTNFARDHNTLHRNQGDLFFKDDSYNSGLASASWADMGWGTRFEDLDHDGDQDLYVANGHIYPEVVGRLDDERYEQADTLYLNDGKGRFTSDDGRIRKQRGPGVSRGVAFGDLDNDGDLDLLVLEMGSKPTLLRNEGLELESLQVRLRGQLSPPDGAGAILTLLTAQLRQEKEATRGGSYCSSSDPRVHFGLASTSPAASRLQVRWPMGKVQRFHGVSAGKEVIVFE